MTTLPLGPSFSHSKSRPAPSVGFWGRLIRALARSIFAGFLRSREGPLPSGYCSPTNPRLEAILRLVSGLLGKCFENQRRRG